MYYIHTYTHSGGGSSSPLLGFRVQGLWFRYVCTYIYRVLLIIAPSWRHTQVGLLERACTVARCPSARPARKAAACH